MIALSNMASLSLKSAKVVLAPVNSLGLTGTSSCFGKLGVDLMMFSVDFWFAYAFERLDLGSALAGGG